jgi:hypothetical protein
MSEPVHERRRRWLKYGNPPGDFHASPRCGGRTRRGTSCLGPAMKNGRCKFHGGKSPGARTPESRERCRRAVTKHGFYPQAAREARREGRRIRIELGELLRLLDHI